jgi:hypothetical protein
VAEERWDMFEEGDEGGVAGGGVTKATRALA